jgi:hypothetical protein
MSARVRWRVAGDENSAGSRLRAFIPVDLLKADGWNCGLYSTAGDSDIVIFQKTYGDSDIELARTLKLAGKKIALDICDNHFYNPGNTPWIEERSVRLQKMIDVCDAVIVSSEELLKYIDHPRKVVIHDAVERVEMSSAWQSLQRIFRPMNRKGKFSIAWFGITGLENPRFGMIDLADIIPALNSVNAQSGIVLNVISDSRKAFDKYTAGAEFEARFHAWERSSFPYLLSQNQLSVIPIQLNPFTACKTANRLIISLLCGVPVVADLIPSYREFEPFIRTGNWTQNVLAALNGDQDKLTSGRQYIADTYNDKRTLNEWADFIRTLSPQTNA